MGVLTLVFTIVLLIVTSILYGLVLIQNSTFIRSNEEHLLLSVGKQLAIDPQVTTALEEGRSNDQLEAYTNEVTHIHGLDFVVVMDMQAIRLTHPDETQIGKHFEGGDEVTALEGKEHVSVSEGTLGRSLRDSFPSIPSLNRKTNRCSSFRDPYAVLECFSKEFSGRVSTCLSIKYHNRRLCSNWTCLLFETATS